MMADDSGETHELLRRAGGGDQQALAELFDSYRDRLRRMVRLRLDRRLLGRVDPSDVLQETYLDVSKRASEYFDKQPMPFFLWLRLMTGQQLAAIHRRHLGAKMRDAGREISLHRGGLPQATSLSLAAQLLGRVTSASQVAMRAEMQIRLQEALNSMDPMDREVLALRHFEELSNSETAEVLGIKKSAASNRYIRAFRRLKETLASMPGFLDP
jgi:RNA polymerase sigma-70 factor (ECF subfamily)